MKKKGLLNFLAFLSNRDTVLITDENGFKKGLGRVNYSLANTSNYFVAKTLKNKYFISSMYLLVIFFFLQVF